MRTPTCRATCNTHCWMIGIGILLGFAMLASPAGAQSDAPQQPLVIEFRGDDLQQVIDEAPSGATIQCNPARELTLSRPITISKPLTLRGLSARLPEKLGGAPLVIIQADGVTLTDFELRGNGDSVPQKNRAPLVEVRADRFHVARGLLLNSSKDGVMIQGSAKPDGDLVGGVVRDLVGRNVIRDTVSISGSGADGRRVRNILVENIRAYDSELRGAVEVSDGSENVTVRTVYAEGCVYAIDVQDHNQPQQINRNVLVEDVYAVRCKHAIRTANHPFGHSNLTVRDITAEQCTHPIQITHTDLLTLANVRVLDQEPGGPAVAVRNCQGVSVRDVAIRNARSEGPAVLLEDCGDCLFDGLVLHGNTDTLEAGVCFRMKSPGTLTGLRITNVSAGSLRGPGILLESSGGNSGTLTDYAIYGNPATVSDLIQGPRRVIQGNLDQNAPTDGSMVPGPQREAAR
ncbi:MAG: hypothetical protein ACOY3P_23885 [Planctomycetota bacterium]